MASERRLPDTLEWLVPPAAMPMPMIALMATSWSTSCESFESVSVTSMLDGLEAESSASASGVARRTGGSPYCSMCR